MNITTKNKNTALHIYRIKSYFALPNENNNKPVQCNSHNYKKLKVN